MCFFCRRHFMHHSKPNIMLKDPDIAIAHIFVVGRRLAQLWGKKKLGTSFFYCPSFPARILSSYKG